jgi:hypothetical protein
MEKAIILVVLVAVLFLVLYRRPLEAATPQPNNNMTPPISCPPGWFPQRVLGVGQWVCTPNGSIS